MPRLSVISDNILKNADKMKVIIKAFNAQRRLRPPFCFFECGCFSFFCDFGTLASSVFCSKAAELPLSELSIFLLIKKFAVVICQVNLAPLGPVGFPRKPTRCRQPRSFLLRAYDIGLPRIRPDCHLEHTIILDISLPNSLEVFLGKLCAHLSSFATAVSSGNRSISHWPTQHGVFPNSLQPLKAGYSAHSFSRIAGLPLASKRFYVHPTRPPR